MNKNSFCKYICFVLVCAIVYGLIMGYYVAVSNGLGDTPFYLQARRFVPMSILTVLTVYLVGRRVQLSYFASFALVALAWCTVYPIAYKITYSATVPFFSNHFDIVFGIYGFAGLIAGFLLLRTVLSTKSTSGFLSLLQFALLLLPIWQLGYITMYRSCVSEAGMMAVYQTTPAEAWEYMVANMGYTGILGSLVMYALVLWFLYRINIIGLANIDFSGLKKLEAVFLLVMALGGFGYSLVKALPETGIVLTARNVRDYFKSAEKFTKYHEETLAKLEVFPSAKHFARPSTIIMVIGESASRYYMSAYGYSERDTTPWLKGQLQNPDFTILKNGYTSKIQTVPSLERALTNKNQYNEIDFNRAVTVIDIARKAGYKTYWFSNQTTIDVADTPITLVGKTADVAMWTNQSVTDKQYDGTLLKYLDKIDPAENNFVVLHFMGSHENTQNRYPKEFTKWGDPNKNEKLLCYDNSICYTDYLLSKIFEHGREKLNMQAMVYFSDHGAVPDHRRHPDHSSWRARRVPYFVYTSKEYAQLYPETVTVLKAHEQIYVTNDLNFELMCSLFDIKSNAFQEENSIASEKYKFNLHNLRTDLGKLKLSDDDGK